MASSSRNTNPSNVYQARIRLVEADIVPDEHDGERISDVAFRNDTAFVLHAVLGGDPDRYDDDAATLSMEESQKLETFIAAPELIFPDFPNSWDRPAEEPDSGLDADDAESSPEESAEAVAETDPDAGEADISPEASSEPSAESEPEPDVEEPQPTAAETSPDVTEPTAATEIDANTAALQALVERFDTVTISKGSKARTGRRRTARRVRSTYAFRPLADTIVFEMMPGGTCYLSWPSCLKGDSDRPRVLVPDEYITTDGAGQSVLADGKTPAEVLNLLIDGNADAHLMSWSARDEFGTLDDRFNPLIIQAFGLDASTEPVARLVYIRRELLRRMPIEAMRRRLEKEKGKVDETTDAQADEIARTTADAAAEGSTSTEAAATPPDPAPTDPAPATPPAAAPPQAPGLNLQPPVFSGPMPGTTSTADPAPTEPAPSGAPDGASSVDPDEVRLTEIMSTIMDENPGISVQDLMTQAQERLGETASA